MRKGMVGLAVGMFFAAWSLRADFIDWDNSYDADNNCLDPFLTSSGAVAPDSYVPGLFLVVGGSMDPLGSWNPTTLSFGDDPLIQNPDSSYQTVALFNGGVSGSGWNSSAAGQTIYVRCFNLDPVASAFDPTLTAVTSVNSPYAAPFSSAPGIATWDNGGGVFVPEPTTLALFGLGLLVAAVRTSARAARLAAAE